MKLLNIAAAAVLALGLTSATASAATITATGNTTVQLNAPLPDLVTPLGNTIDNGGGSYSFPVTGVQTSGDDITLLHEGSGLSLLGFDLLDFQYTLGTPLTFPITLFGDVRGAADADDQPLFSIAPNVDDELELALTQFSGTALGLEPGFVVGQVTGLPEIRQVPEPTTLMMLGAALALAGRRLRRS